MKEFAWATLHGEPYMENWAFYDETGKLHVVTIVNGFQPSTIATKTSILVILEGSWIRLEEQQSLVLKVVASRKMVINKSHFAILSVN